MEYKIEGQPLPVVTCQLQPGEAMITERGSMCWMSPNMKMETGAKGGLGRAFGRMFAGEALLPLENSLSGVIGAVIGLALPLCYLLLTEKKRRLNPKWTPKLVRVIHAKKEE